VEAGKATRTEPCRRLNRKRGSPIGRTIGRGTQREYREARVAIGAKPIAGKRRAGAANP